MRNRGPRASGGAGTGVPSSARGSAGVGSEGVEPSRHWVRARCATSAPRARDRCSEAGARLPCRAIRRAGGRGPVVGREGVEPSGLRLKAGCRTVRRAPRAKNYVCSVETIAIVRGPPHRTDGSEGGGGTCRRRLPRPATRNGTRAGCPRASWGAEGPRTDGREDRGRKGGPRAEDGELQKRRRPPRGIPGGLDCVPQERRNPPRSGPPRD